MNSIKIVFILILFVSCAKPPPDPVPFEPPDPSWIESSTHQSYPQKWFILGVGTSAKNMDNAKQNARLEVARQIEVEVVGKIEMVDQEEMVGNSGYESSQTERQSESIVEQKLPGLRIVETYKMAEKFYALAILDRRKLSAELEFDISEDEKLVESLREDARNAMNRGGIPHVVASLVDAYDIANDVAYARSLYRAIAPTPMPDLFSSDNTPTAILREFREFISRIKLSKIDDRKLSVKLTLLRDDHKSMALIGVPIRFEYASGEAIGMRITDEKGGTELDQLTPNFSMGGQLIATPIIELPDDFIDILPPIRSVIFNIPKPKSMPQIELKIRSGLGKKNLVERKVSKVLEDLGYVVSESGDFLLICELKIDDVRNLPGLRKQVVVQLQLKLSIGNGKSVIFPSTGIGKNKRAAIAMALGNVKFNRAKFELLLARGAMQR